MNPAPLTVRLALFVALLLPALSFAQTSPPAKVEPVATERFLVIVETSAAMQKRAENVQKALGSVISSGLSGNIGYGSTIGVWTFNEQLFTGQLPLQLWTPANRQRVALTMVQFLQQQKNEKAARLPVAWAAATNIIAQSERITVLLITSGNDPVTGTPFDAAITESFIKNADAQRKANMPYLTILRAVKGKFVAFAVNMPPWPLEVPEYPDGFKPAPPPAPVVVETNPPAPVVKRPDPFILAATNTIYLAETSPPVEVPVVAPQPKSEPTNVVVAKAESPTPPRPNVPAAAAPVETKSQPATKPAEPVAVAPDPAKFPIVTILVAGIALLLGVMVVFIALLRW
ncbi:MAG: hypothetical protein AAB370_00810, partial [Verrucomicrobiota bacterium]